MYRLKLAVACFVMGERSGYLGSDLRFQGIALTIGLWGWRVLRAVGAAHGEWWNVAPYLQHHSTTIAFYRQKVFKFTIID